MVTLLDSMRQQANRLLTERMTIMRSEQTRDGYGGRTLTWAPVRQISTLRVPPSAPAVPTNAEGVEIPTATFLVRAEADIKVADRFTYRETRWRVTSITAGQTLEVLTRVDAVEDKP
jgi:head-tail adaptor